MKKTLLSALLVLSLINQPVNASDDLNVNKMVYVMHKFKGACGFISTIKKFQNGLQMDGADNFIRKLFHYEAARIGYTVNEYASTCVNSREVAANAEVLNIDAVDSDDFKTYLSISEITGYCGVYNSATQLISNGTEQDFFARFMATELIKTGDSLESFLNICEVANLKYLDLIG